jgi:hypothetical protein
MKAKKECDTRRLSLALLASVENGCYLHLHAADSYSTTELRQISNIKGRQNYDKRWDLWLEHLKKSLTGIAIAYGRETN